MSIYRLSNYNTCNGRLRQPDHIMGENPADFSRRMIVSVSARLALLLLEGCFVYYCVLAENSEQYQALRRRLALQTLSITDVGENQITVNAGVTTLLVTLTGASGGRALNSAHGQYGLGGLGGVITAYIAVIPGENLKFFIGGAGTSNGAGGFNGGGSPCINANLPGGSGGGATDLRRSPYGLANRLLVAGGGGGAYSEYIANGGAGGYPNGADGDQGDGVYRTPSAYPPGGGGTQTQGGTGTNGQAGALGQGGNCQGANGAGGGGGYYGGGSAFAVGCGGGSSYASAGYVSSGVATATGDGSAVVSWDIEPTITPSTNPSVTPTSAPSSQPSSQPSRQPSRQPVAVPSGQPSLQPSHQPTSSPTVQPSAQPSGGPTDQPTSQPSMSPTQQPVGLPSSTPSSQPTSSPTGQPSTQPSGQPSKQPSEQPSSQPSNPPTMQPTGQPSCQPSGQPSARPTDQPSSQPSAQPSSQPSVFPSVQPSTQPSSQPSGMPSTQPSVQPSKLPSTQPVSQPSSQPSDTPSCQPSNCPTTQPSVQPSKQPSAQPSDNPTSPPTSQPSMIPTTQPSAQPVAAPTTKPSAQPSSLPSVQPSELPSSQPSEQPSYQPSSDPSAQPSSSPSGEPSAQPSTTPSVQPSVAPSRQPSTQPTHDPTSQPLAVPSSQPASTPSAQPSQQPSSQPLTKPSVQPSSAPTARPTLQFLAREYVYLMPSEARMTFTNVAHIGGADWGCGTQFGSATCVVVVSPGIMRTQHLFPWNETTFALRTSDLSQVVLTGYTTTADFCITAIAKCFIGGTQLLCTVQSFRDTVYRTGALVPAAGRKVYVGTSSGFTTLAISDESVSIWRSYKYTSNILGSITLLHIQSTPNFIGSFIAGTCTSVGLTNYIFLSMLRTDSGVMTGMYITPTNSIIHNCAELVNAMALEYVNPDAYIAGGLQLLGESEPTAYIVRVNGLFQSVRYGMRYRAILSHSRRLHSESNSVISVVKGLVIAEAALHVLISWNASLHENGINRISLLRTDLVTGAILQQVHILSHNISLHCTDMTSAGLLLTLSCTVHYPVNGTRPMLLSFDRELTFSKLPKGFMRNEELVFLAESMLFKRVSVPLTVHTADITSTEYTFTTADGAPTLQPSASAVPKPSMQPSSAPSGQPCSIPTSAPSVSPQPTNQPSSSGPTNTYKPTVKPTQRPSRVPSPNPTVTPTHAPSKPPTARPTVHPSRNPTAQPSAAPTTTPSRAPKSNPTTKPTAVPSITVTVVPSSETESTGGGIYSGDSPTSSSRKTSNIVLVTGGSIIGGLLLLWCGHRLLRWYVLAVDARERKNEMRVIIERKQSLLIMDLLSTDINARSRIDRGRGRGAYATGPPMTDSALCIAPNTAAATPPHHVPELVNLPHEVGSCEVSSISASGLGSESSLVLSSLHSSEMSLFDNSEVLKNGVLSELSTPIALSLHTQSRSQESAMEEGNVATEGSNNEYSDITSEDSIQVSSESEDN